MRHLPAEQSPMRRCWLINVVLVVLTAHVHIMTDMLCRLFNPPLEHP